MIKKLALSGAFFVLATAQAASLSQLDDGWRLSFNSCSYGRGTSAIADAKKDAPTHAIRVFESQRSNFTDSSTLPTNEQFITRVNQEQASFLFGSTYLQGSETCIPVQYDLQIGDSESGFDWDWDSDDGVQLRIQASSQAKGSLSSAQAAEVEALRQGILTALARMVDDVSGFEHLAAVPTSFVKDWLVLERQEESGTATVIVEMVLDQEALSSLANDSYHLVGKPRFLIHSDTTIVKQYLDAVIAERGWLISQRLSDADVIISVETALTSNDIQAQLGMSLSLFDKDGLQLGRWSNQARSLSLPTADGIHDRLASIHFNQNDEVIMSHIDDALSALHSAGGVWREIAVSDSSNITITEVAEKLQESSFVNNVKIVDVNESQTIQFRSRLSAEHIPTELLRLNIDDAGSALHFSQDEDGRLILN